MGGRPTAGRRRGSGRRAIRQRTALNLSHARAVLAGSAAKYSDGGGRPVHHGSGSPRVRSEEDWTLGLLMRENVLAQPGFFYDFESEAYLVLSLLTAPEIFQQGIARIRTMVEG